MLNTLITKFKRQYQRFFRGFDDQELASLDYTISKFTVVRLKRFREITISHPFKLKHEEWEKILDEMIWTFDFLSSDLRWDEESKEVWDRVDKGLDLFRKYYLDLWI